MTPDGSTGKRRAKTGPAALGPTILVDIRAFKREARRRLPAGHPLLRLLQQTEDDIPLGDLAARYPDWAVLLES